MALAITLISLGLQAAAALAAFGLARRSRHSAWLFLALAALLMAVRRAFSLHGALVMGRPLDPGAEWIALAISVVMLGGFLYLRRSAAVEGEQLLSGGQAQPRTLRRLTRVALVLGLLAVLASAAAGYGAFLTSRVTVVAGLVESNRALAHALAARADLRAAEGQPAERTLAELPGLWRQLVEPGRASHLSVVDAAGRLALHTRSPRRVGLDVGALRLAGSEPASDVRGLLSARRDYAGAFTAPDGERQIVALAYSAGLDGLVAIHTPLSVAEARVREAAFPWASALLIVGAALFPLALLLLHWGYRSAERSASEAVAALRAGEERLELALAAGGLGTFDWEMEGGGVHWNEQHARLWGLELSEFDGRYESVRRRVHPEDLERIERAMDEARAAREPYAVEYRVVWPDGTQRWIAGRARFLFDAGGQATRLTGIVADITAKKQADEELAARLRQQEAVAALGRRALVGAPLSALLDEAVRSLAAELEVELCELLELQEGGAPLLLRAGVGWPPQAAAGSAVYAGAGSHAGHALASAAPVVFNELASEARFVAPSRLLELGVTSGIAVRLPGERDAGGCGLLGAYSRTGRRFSADDVHFAESVALIVAAALQRSRSDEARRRSEERFEKAFRSNPAAMCITTLAEGRCLDANDRFLALVGLRREEALGRSLREPGFWADARERARLVELLRERRSLRDFSFSYRAGGGELREARGAFELIEAEGVPCILTLVEDLSELRRLEGQLLQSQKMEAVGRLAGGIAHDFNNLLNVIVGYGTLLARETEIRGSARRKLEQVLEAADRAASLTRQLLAFGRRQVLQPRVADLNQIVRQAAGLLERLLGEDVELAFEPAPGLGNVRVDAAQIEQVIVNLAVNARDAMPDGGKLTIATANVEIDEALARTLPSTQPGPHVLLSVSDTGVGMDSATQSRVFEPFFTTKAEGQGTGLGLATAYGIVKQSGGSIWVYSEPGRGTTFKVYLPRVFEAVTAIPVAGENRPAAAGRETLLVAEDEDMAREMIRDVLEGFGYTVLAAANGKEALALARGHDGPIHLLLTDVVMPGMSGVALSEAIHETRPETRLLFMSGYPDRTLARHGVLDPAVAFIQKPFRPDALAAKVRAVLDWGSPAANGAPGR